MVVLFIQGRSAAAVPAFDLAYADYSWMVNLADAGFDVFAMDLQGYGSSSKPAAMDDPCNTSHRRTGVPLNRRSPSRRRLVRSARPRTVDAGAYATDEEAWRRWHSVHIDSEHEFRVDSKQESS